MKFKWNKKYGRIAAYAVGAVVVSGILLFALKSLPSVGEALGFLGGVFSSIIWGVCIAYLLNPALKFFELRVFGRWQKKATSRREKKRIRSLSLTIVVILTLALLVGLFWLVLPQVASSAAGIAEKVPGYIENLQKWGEEAFKNDPQFLEIIRNPIEQIQTGLNNLWEMIKPNITSYITSMGSGVVSFLSGFMDFVIGFIIAIYFLLAKEMLIVQFKKLMFAFLRNGICQRVLTVCKKANEIFLHYITGLLIDAFFVGCMTFIGASIIGTPFPVLLAVIIAITNFIPFFGPFIGGIPAAVLVFMVDPLKALWFILFMLALQQFDGNVMVPFIQGDKTGVPSVWVLMAIIVGGGLFGFAGMLLAVPVFAVIYMFGKEIINTRLDKKALPTQALVYERDLTKMTDDYVYTDEDRAADEEWLSEIAEEDKKHRLRSRIAEKKELRDKKLAQVQQENLSVPTRSDESSGKDKQ